MLGRHRYFRNWLARLTRPGQLPSVRCRAGELCVIRVQSGGLRSLRAGGVGPGLNQECWASEGRRRVPQLRQRAGLSLLCPLAGQCPPAPGEVSSPCLSLPIPTLFSPRDVLTASPGSHVLPAPWVPFQADT